MCGTSGSALQQFAFPVYRGRYNDFEIIVPGGPFKRFVYLVYIGNQLRWVSSASWLFYNVDGAIDYLLDGVQHVAHTVAMSITAIQSSGFPTLAQIVEG